MTRIVRPLRGGQITIPAEFRKKLGISPEGLLQLTLEDGELRIRPVRISEAGEGSPWLKELYELFAPVRTEAVTSSEDDINAAIDKATRAVRKKRA